jgi:hypothetical protein
VRAVTGNRGRSGLRSVSFALALTASAVLVGAPSSAGAVGSRTAAEACRVGAQCVQQARTMVVSAPHQGGAGFKPLPRPVAPEIDKPFIPPQGTPRLPKTIGLPTVAGANGPTGGLTASVRERTPSRSSVVAKSFVRSDLGTPPRSGTPQEPTTAIGDKVVWYTGNTSVALSINSGTSFSYFDPSTILPDGSLPLCCDQLVTYAPKQKLFVWVLQYWCGKGTSSPTSTNCYHAGTTSNRVRIAVASPNALRAHFSSPGPAWTYWDFTPRGFAGQLGGRGTWFDQSKLGVNQKYMNWSVDVLRGKSSVSSVFGRISLSSLAARGTVILHYLTDTNEKINVAQGLSTSTTYFTGGGALSQSRIWSWAASSSAVLHLISHSTVPHFNGAINGTNGSNWYSRWGIFPGAVESATVHGTTLYLAQGTGRDYCTANCTSSTPTLKAEFKEPAIFISTYSVTSWKEVAERWIWNPKIAFGFPALDTDDAGDVGIVYRISAEGQNPRPAVEFLTPGAHNSFYYVEPAGLPLKAGDYYSLRPGRSSKSFVMTAQTVNADNRMHWQYVEWGRGSAP